MTSEIESNNGNNGNRKPSSFLTVCARRLLIRELVENYKRNFSEDDFEKANPPEQFKENEKNIYVAFTYRSKYLMIIRFDKNEIGQPVLKMTPSRKNSEKQIEIIQLDKPQDNTPKLSAVPPISEFE